MSCDLLHPENKSLHQLCFIAMINLVNTLDFFCCAKRFSDDVIKPTCTFEERKISKPNWVVLLWPAC
jgi:hypothetical protein